MAKLRLLLVAWICCAAAAAAAQERRVALVIGNGAYASVGHLQNPTRDARTIAEALRTAGFQSVQVEQDLGRDAMLAALRRFETAADDADWALIYYAGHGVEVAGVNYLIPTDARVRSDRDVEDETISLPQVQKRLEGARRLRLVILDACRDNPFLAVMKRTQSSRSVGRGLARPELPQAGSLVAYAAAAGQIAADGSARTNSPYVAALVRNLAIPDVEVNLFFRRVRADVLSATGQKQEPATYESLPAERFVFRPLPAPEARSALTPPAGLAATVAALPVPVPSPAPSPVAPGQAGRRTELVGACDRLASAPTDPDRPAGVKGIAFAAIDAGAAIPACRAAAEAAPDDRRVRYQLGRSLSAGRRQAEARAEYEAAAAAGSPPAMTNLGNLYMDGQGVPRDPAAALRWFEKAAAAGESVAMTNLASVYEAGKGVPQDHGQARGWYERAAALGNPAAMGALGILYDNGRGVARDSAAARVWFEKAAALGNGLAMKNLGILHQYGRGGPRDAGAARDWYGRAIAQGEWHALRSMGLLSEQGEGGAPDYAAARDWYEKAMKAGDSAAAFNLGLLYENGRGVPKDYGEAWRWYERGAGAGNPASTRALAILLMNGLGVPRDDARAAVLFEKAAGEGEVLAMYNLGYLYAEGRGVTRDYAAARTWYEKAAAGGNGSAMNNLGVLYGNGRGVRQDYAEARRWYEKAAAAGNAKARENLAGLGRKGL